MSTPLRRLAALAATLLCPATFAAEGPSSAAAPPAAPQASAAIDPSGEWRGARWGMSVEEVLRAFPGEARRVEPALELADGAVVAVRIDRQEIAGHPFRVGFVFEGGKLALVSLRTPQDRPAGAEVYEGLAKLLGDRFGARGERSADDNFVDLRQTRWRLARGAVDLKYVPGVIVVLYHPLAAPDGSR